MKYFPLLRKDDEVKAKIAHKSLSLIAVRLTEIEEKQEDGGKASNWGSWKKARFSNHLIKLELCYLEELEGHPIETLLKHVFSLNFRTWFVYEMLE